MISNNIYQKNTYKWAIYLLCRLEDTAPWNSANRQ